MEMGDDPGVGMMGSGGGDTGDGMTGMGDGGMMGPDMELLFELVWRGEAVRADGFICEEHPPKLSSDGVWERVIVSNNGLPIWHYRLPNLEIVILIVFFLWQASNILFKKLRLSIPKFTSMMFVSSSSSSLIFASAKS